MQRLAAGAVILLAMGAALSGQAAPRETVLHSFLQYNGTDGVNPIRGVVMDSAGFLYGSSFNGGSYPNYHDNIFKIAPPLPGTTRSIGTEIYVFADPAEGNFLLGDLALDGQGRIYGVTTYGGASNDGTVYMLTPPLPGQTAWTKTTLRNFSGPDGAYPDSGVILDNAGNLYGVAPNGGTSNGGVAYKLTPPSAGQTAWTEQVLYDFDVNSNKPASPGGPLLADGQGGFYAVAYSGNALHNGAVIALKPPAAGQAGWTETPIYTFLDGADGNYPSAGALVADATGALYGMTRQGGAGGVGTVYKLSPRGAGAWSYTLLHTFDINLDGGYPSCGLYLDKAGNLYGTSQYGGVAGTVFQLAPPAAGQTVWREKLFSFSGKDGRGPSSTLIPGSAGSLIGTTQSGGRYGSGGTTFEIHP